MNWILALLRVFEDLYRAFSNPNQFCFCMFTYFFLCMTRKNYRSVIHINENVTNIYCQITQVIYVDKEERRIKTTSLGNTNIDTYVTFREIPEAYPQFSFI